MRSVGHFFFFKKKKHFTIAVIHTVVNLRTIDAMVMKDNGTCRSVVTSKLGTS
eukprot:SAG11_NODE_52_length_19809_cov_14.064231_20_plen_53_part_00